MTQLFETLETRQFFSAGGTITVLPSVNSAPAIHAENTPLIRNASYIGYAARSDGKVAVKLEMKLERKRDGTGVAKLRINMNDGSHEDIKLAIDATGQFTYTMVEDNKNRVLTGGLNADGSVFSGNWTEYDKTTNETLDTGTFRLVRAQPRQNFVKLYKGVANTAHGPQKLAARLTHLDSGYLAEFAVRGPNGTEIIFAMVNEDGSFSFDKKDNDGGTTHIQGAFSATFRVFSGMWSSVHNDTTESGDFNGRQVG